MQNETLVNPAPRARMLGIGIDPRSLSDLIAEAISAIKGNAPPVILACANPHSLVVARKDKPFRHALNNATQVVADGVGITFMARVANIPVGPRITGTDYFFALMQVLENHGGGRVFFFGSSDKVLALITERITKLFPSIEIATCSPPFRAWTPEENEEMIAAINRGKPDILWVGMTAPKQEKWVEANRDRLHAPFIGSIGAVFDFVAGTHPRAPQWMCSLGIEWVYRLLREPRRMWKRNLISAPTFVSLVVWRHIVLRGH